jgi:hypothetical protein
MRWAIWFRGGNDRAQGKMFRGIFDHFMWDGVETSEDSVDGATGDATGYAMYSSGFSYEEVR